MNYSREQPMRPGRMRGSDGWRGVARSVEGARLLWTCRHEHASSSEAIACGRKWIAAWRPRVPDQVSRPAPDATAPELDKRAS